MSDQPDYEAWRPRYILGLNQPDDDQVTHSPEDAEKFQHKYAEPDEPDPWSGP